MFFYIKKSLRNSMNKKVFIIVLSVVCASYVRAADTENKNDQKKRHVEGFKKSLALILPQELFRRDLEFPLDSELQLFKKWNHVVSLSSINQEDYQNLRLELQKLAAEVYRERKSVASLRNSWCEIL